MVKVEMEMSQRKKAFEGRMIVERKGK